MTRARAAVLLVAGCALAAAAAADGPLLGERTGKDRPFGELFRLDKILRIRRVRKYYTNVRPTGLAHVLDVAVGGVVLGIALVVLAVVLWRLGSTLARMARLRLGPAGGSAVTSEYDPGEESSDDAETALRRRVREELTALSADLDAYADAREAVIACYVRMEHALAEAGSPRRATESPLELVSRVLAEHHVPEPDVRRLTDLFTEARFSRHVVTEDMRAAARRSLGAVADALAVPA